MFFHKYSKLTAEDVRSKFAAVSKASSPLPTVARDKLIDGTLKLSGEFAPELSFKFIDTERVTITENGNSFEVPFTSAALGTISIVTYKVPGSERTFTTILDSETLLVTVFETWFGITVPVGGNLFGGEATGSREIPREVQRHYWFGYIDTGKPAPEKLHGNTNRLEGKGLYWEFEHGKRHLTFYPSILCSTTVELNHQGLSGDSITITTPADYIKITDEYYIYANWEAEFSGIGHIAVLDLFSLKALTLTIGFDENDAALYRFVGAKLKITGDAAHLEHINDHGEDLKKDAGMALDGKGARYAYRPADMHLPMTRDEIIKVCTEKQALYEGSSIMSSANTMPFTTFLAGKAFKVILDNEKHIAAPWAGDNKPVYSYEFIDDEHLKISINGSSPTIEKYRGFEPAKDIYLFSHQVTGDPNFLNLTVAADFSTGLVTVVHGQIGSWLHPHEASGYAKFGILDYPGVKPPFARRHHFTTDLVGKSFAWSYSDQMASIHVYSSPESYSWTIFTGENAGGASWSSPCFYVKLRDDAYLFQWVEENCNGGQGLVVFNPYIMHDAGYFYGASENGLQLTIMGAYARKVGSFDIEKYFN
ncbi:MAG: molybdenum cofactor biosynthesis F family protein [Oscillospiraceae bacterium]|jgi:hypothetical protein|nr:molybdenum cofactor biosynthesis F family protein [Oscillospiraceae bacterium]